MAPFFRILGSPHFLKPAFTAAVISGVGVGGYELLREPTEQEICRDALKPHLLETPEQYVQNMDDCLINARYQKPKYHYFPAPSQN